MDILKNLLNSLVPILGQTAVDALADQLKDVTAGMDEGWKKTVLSLLTNAVEQYGPDGIQIALTAITDLMDNKPPKIDWADLEVASDIVAQLQNAEANKKSAVNDFLVKISDILGKILQGIIKGLIAAKKPAEGEQT